MPTFEDTDVNIQKAVAWRDFMNGPAVSILPAGGSIPSFAPSAELANAAIGGSGLPAQVTGAGLMSANRVVGPEAALAVDQASQDMGVRVERALSSLAYRAAAQGMQKLAIATSTHFLDGIHHELIGSLDLAGQGRDSILNSLAAELSQFVKNKGSLRGDWGTLSMDGDGNLAIDLARRFNPNRPLELAQR